MFKVLFPCAYVVDGKAVQVAAGAVVDVPKDEADRLVEEGYLEPVTKKAATKAEPKSDGAQSGS